MKLKERLRGLIDVSFVIIVAIGSIYAYDEYKTLNKKVFVVDTQRIYQLKQSGLSVSTATEDDISKHYASLEKLIIFSNNYINTVSNDNRTLVYQKNHILTAKSTQMIDLTDDLMSKLKVEKLLP
ncbi:MAG: hypothetical protein WC667_05080 [Sulfurimonas sp.]|jgi:Skp family chaperone for outer membrane proteins